MEELEESSGSDSSEELPDVNVQKKGISQT